MVCSNGIHIIHVSFYISGSFYVFLPIARVYTYSFWSPGSPPLLIFKLSVMHPLAATTIRGVWTLLLKLRWQFSSSAGNKCNTSVCGVPNGRHFSEHLQYETVFKPRLKQGHYLKPIQKERLCVPAGPWSWRGYYMWAVESMQMCSRVSAPWECACVVVKWS